MLDRRPAAGPRARPARAAAPARVRIAGCRPRAISRSSSSPTPSSCSDSLEQLRRDLRARLQLRLRDAQLDRDRHEMLLRAVVEVALQPAPLLVARPRHEPRARRDQVRAGLRARDRQRHQLAERAQPALGVVRERLLARDRDRAPQRARRRRSAPPPTSGSRRGRSRPRSRRRPRRRPSRRSAPARPVRSTRPTADDSPAASRSPTGSTSTLSRLTRPTIVALSCPS